MAATCSFETKRGTFGPVFKKLIFIMCKFQSWTCWSVLCRCLCKNTTATLLRPVGHVCNKSLTIQDYFLLFSLPLLWPSHATQESYCFRTVYLFILLVIFGQQYLRNGYIHQHDIWEKRRCVQPTLHHQRFYHRPHI